MHRFAARVPVLGVALLAAVALATGACNNNPVLPTNPITGTPVTDSFSGTLSKNGAFTHAFSISTLGSITAAIVALAPNSAQIVGLQLGVWNGTSCTASSSTDVATTGSSITLTASGAGVVCARLYDVGFINEPVLYQLQIVHP
jgi:hypothetical protein